MFVRKEGTVLGFGLALLLAGVAASAASLVWQEGFEAGKVDLGRWNIKGDAPVVQSQITRSGKYAAKFVLNRLTSSDNNRTELRAKESSPKWFEDVWYGLSIYLPSPYPTDEIMESLANWHGVWDKDLGEQERGGAPLSLQTKDGRWQLERRWDERAVSTKDSGKGTTYHLGSYDRDLAKWTDWVFHVRWDYRNNGVGHLSVWKNGVQVVNANGPIGQNDAVAPYFKWGFYKPRWAYYASDFGNERVGYHDEFRMAIGQDASYNDVAPGGGLAQTPNPPTSLAVQ